MTALGPPLPVDTAERGLANWFSATYERHYDLVLRRCLQLLHDRELAEERTHDTFLRLWRSCLDARYDGANDQGWLLKVATNLCIDEMRRGIRAHDARDPGARFVTWHRMEGEGLGVDTSGAWEESILHPAFTEPQTPELAYLGVEAHDTVQAALRQLPAHHRAVMVLRLAERSYGEIADTLGTSTAAVKSLLHRAREAIRPALRRYLDAPEHKGAQPCA